VLSSRPYLSKPICFRLGRLLIESLIWTWEESTEAIAILEGPKLCYLLQLSL
jgi:hypothetical protein